MKHRQILFRLAAGVGATLALTIGAFVSYPKQVINLCPEPVLYVLGLRAPGWGQLSVEMYESSLLMREMFNREHEIPTDLNEVIEIVDRQHRASGYAGFKWLRSGRDPKGQPIRFFVTRQSEFGHAEIKLWSSGENMIFGDSDDVFRICYADVLQRTDDTAGSVRQRK